MLLATTRLRSLAYRQQFRRDGGSVRDLLSQRDAPFQDYRERARNRRSRSGEGSGD